MAWVLIWRIVKVDSIAGLYLGIRLRVGVIL